MTDGMIGPSLAEAEHGEPAFQCGAARRLARLQARPGLRPAWTQRAARVSP
eukprot:CAMPEP_0113828198 /NCGR_PEP_ID=MMETSP0328-20130328/5156_1 /TAXON_ID=39455 /ORGANISM="Alexandrium minutum" /LENGTH=50 /DNA_ID=CAMNT_0000796205 /DNA_START=104 /DNA_END=253 /DNA_ORIENTATION=+ /assembly_acc=CAM_ASM_000350